MKKKLFFAIRKSKSLLLFSVLVSFFLVACDKTSPIVDGGSSVEDGVFVSLTIKKMPNKIGYFIDEPFVSEGLVVEAKYDNGATKVIANDKLAFSGFDSSLPVARQPITVTYEGKSTEFPLEVYPFTVTNQTEITRYEADEINVVIPAGVTKIGNQVFTNKKLETITFPATLTDVGIYAFSKCAHLKAVDFPASLLGFGEGVFNECTSLESADLSKTQITNIPSYMFNECTALATVKLPATIIRINSLAFMKTAKLKNIELPEKLRLIGLDAFNESGLESISIPNNVKVIRQRAFAHCASLLDVTTFGQYSPNEDGLTPVMETSAFEGLVVLRKFVIPLGITKIENLAVSGVSTALLLGLNSIAIPFTVAEIGASSFLYTGITRVEMGGIVPPKASGSSWNAFPSGARIAVPLEALQAYETALGWRNYTIIAR